MKLSIGKKLTGSYLVGFILFLLSIGLSTITVDRLLTTTREMDNITAMVQLTGNLRLRINQLLIPVNRYAFTGDVRERDNFDNVIQEISKILLELKDLKGDDIWQGVANRIATNAVHLGDKAIEVLYTENPVGNKHAAELLRGVQKQSQELIADAEGFYTLTKNEVSLRRTVAENEVKKVRAILLWLMVTAVAMFLIVPFYLFFFVKKPIRELHKGVGIVAGGDLSHTLQVRSSDEIGDLASEFNRMAASLGTMKSDLEKKVQNLYTLYGISGIIGTGLELKELLRTILSEVTDKLQPHRSLVLLVDEDGKELNVAAAANFPGDVPRLRYQVGEGLFGQAFKTGESRLITDIRTAEGILPKDIIVPDAGSAIVLPLRSRGKSVGVLAFFKQRPFVFVQDDFDILKAVADHVAIALENAQLFKEVHVSAVCDELTGLYSQRYFVECLNDEMVRAARYNRPFSLLVLGLDYFKQYNAINGVDAGDTVLKRMAVILKEEVRNTDIVARYGADQFVVVVPETDKEGAVILAERLRKEVEHYPFHYKESQPGGNLTISIGLSYFPTDASNPEDLILRAEKALYRAKRAGKNCVVKA